MPRLINRYLVVSNIVMSELQEKLNDLGESRWRVVSVIPYPPRTIQTQLLYCIIFERQDEMLDRAEKQAASEPFENWFAQFQKDLSVLELPARVQNTIQRSLAPSLTQWDPDISDFVACCPPAMDWSALGETDPISAHSLPTFEKWAMRAIRLHESKRAGPLYCIQNMGATGRQQFIDAFNAKRNGARQPNA